MLKDLLHIIDRITFGIAHCFERVAEHFKSFFLLLDLVLHQHLHPIAVFLNARQFLLHIPGLLVVPVIILTDRILELPFFYFSLIF